MKIEFDKTWKIATLYLDDPRVNPASGSFRVMRAGSDEYKVLPNISFSGHFALAEEFWDRVKLAGDTAMKIADILNGAGTFENAVFAIEQRWPDEVLNND